MGKIKKTLSSFAIFIAGTFSKVYASSDTDISLSTFYGVSSGSIGNIKEPSQSEKIISIIGKFVVPIALFIIGLFIIFSKKINKKIKVLFILGLIVLSELIYIISYNVSQS